MSKENQKNFQVTSFTDCDKDKSGVCLNLQWLQKNELLFHRRQIDSDLIVRKFYFQWPSQAKRSGDPVLESAGTTGIASLIDFDQSRIKQNLWL